MSERVVVIGAGIVGVSTAIWLQRFGVQVTLVDRGAPGQGTSNGNAGVLAACSMVPVTGPGLIKKAPGMLRDPNFPLFLRWRYLPKLLPWLIKYMGHANDADTRRIAEGLTDIVADTVEQHDALNGGTPAAEFVCKSDYSFAYGARSDFEKEAYVWELRRQAGFTPVLREGAEVHDYEPSLGPDIGFLATVENHGYVRDPAGYVAALAAEFKAQGGSFVKGEVRDFELNNGRVTAVLTASERLECDRAVVCTGVWSKTLMRKLGLNVPLESERGYHVLFEDASGGPSHPVMVAGGKFVATPMAAGLRCAGVVEFGGLEAGPSKAPLALLRRKAREAFPGMTAVREDEWLGHRPATTDSLPLIGETPQKGVFCVFGHQHIGLTGGPKSGRLVAEMMTGRPPNIDMRRYDPLRFAGAMT